MTDKKNTHEIQHETGVLTKPKVKEPNMYQVLLLNDDYTTMDFVVQVLEKFFHMTFAQAHRIMLHVHHKGKGECGIYPYDVAVTKIAQVHDYARQHEMPLKCVMEKA